VWSDGAGTTGGPAGVGFVAVSGGHRLSGSRSLRNATNQQAELHAAIHALEQLPAGSTVLLVSDSRYLVTNWNEHLREWKLRGWRRRGSNAAPVNLGLWQRLEEAVGRHLAVNFEWTKGHAGTEGNEEADRLAVEARSRALADSAFTSDQRDR
jgi:ribonuclease HI